jgi:hypothetical protein
LLKGTHYEARYRFLVLEHPHLRDEEMGGSASWRARKVGRSLKIPSHPT